MAVFNIFNIEAYFTIIPKAQQLFIEQCSQGQGPRKRLPRLDMFSRVKDCIGADRSATSHIKIRTAGAATLRDKE